MKDTIVLYPAPGLSHLVSLVELGKLIIHHYSHRFSLTVLLSSGDSFKLPAVDSYIDHISQTDPSIVFHRLPALPNPETSPPTTTFQIIRRNNPNLLHTLQTISNTSSIAALVIDFFCNPAFPIAVDLNIPLYFYVPTGASAVSLFLYLPTIHNQSDKSLRELGNTNLDIPGLPPIRAAQMPEVLHDRNSEFYDELLDMSINFTKSKGIISNTFQALEPRAIEAVEQQTLAFFCIGPLVVEPRDQSTESDCLRWLDAQPSRSVVFLSFGTRGVFPAKQIAEIAEGLERSGQRFLWVVRSPPPVHDSGKRLSLSATDDFDLDAVMPEGFLDRTRDRGLVVKSWAPQVEVLSRKSVGGFVTHCGWNSILEAVCAGVSMLAWPLYAEQEVNKVFLVEEMKLAMPMEAAEDGIVVAAEVEKRVGALMDSDEGAEMRKRCSKMRVKALAAWAEEGSSKNAFINLAKSLERK
ncbi:UDP-glycosyltransferase 88F3-like [Macadamia integrifolia]|uniref:UDP-glycosyltransferase 88F3-like n=1 Tax=Macadamia integrifolia TaxID=60698 RepID=UPI001C52EE38|nr:UDP-glycosyltransferase 88F3-like [Macadamia integrifolia]